MKLRLAKKIIKFAGTDRESRYNQYQYDRAFARLAKTASEKATNRYWDALMFEIQFSKRIDALAEISPELAIQAIAEDRKKNRDRIVKVPVPNS